MQAIHHHHTVEILRGIVLYISLQNQYIAMLHSSIGIGIGITRGPILLDIGQWVPCLVSF